ncbi:hypothetical protein D3C71_2007810 [compost metagenome]
MAFAEPVPLTVVCWPQGRACGGVLLEARLSTASGRLHPTPSWVNAPVGSPPVRVSAVSPSLVPVEGV